MNQRKGGKSDFMSTTTTEDLVGNKQFESSLEHGGVIELLPADDVLTPVGRGRGSATPSREWVPTTFSSPTETNRHSMDSFPRSPYSRHSLSSLTNGGIRGRNSLAGFC
eukprot:TRINITY_DN33662_c0_g1_i1.p1 TRINITY_DN33662_c0_g1~~TRINITY_DN33662_c0_g1_i1.p1  ORF type:complete len:127 (+),score=16.75 TRINITY_DN33662_c0_g1_i1:56-382(+)